MDTKLNNQQLKAVTHGKGPLLIIAGAGTGKTTVITERIKHLILKKHINPSEILALTFTEKAAMEMEERVDKIMPYGYTQMWISTFHSFCDRILRQEAVHIGLTPGYKLLTQTESILLIRKNLFEFNLRYFRPLGNPNKFLEGILQHFSRLKDEDVNTDEYLKFAKNKKGLSKEELEKTIELANAYKTYEEIKIKALNELNHHMKPELINRIDRVLVFKPLSMREITKIVGLEIESLASRLKDTPITIDSRATKILAEKSYNPKEGARTVRRQIQTLVEEPLADLLLESKSDIKEVSIKSKNGKIVVEKK